MDIFELSSVKKMSIELNKYVMISKFNKDEYLKRFIPLVIEYAPNFDEFSIYDLKESINLSESDKKIFETLTFDIRKHLVDNGIAKMYGSRQITLTDKGRSLKDRMSNNISIKKSWLKIFFSNPWVIGISLVLLAAILNANRIMDAINNLLNKL